MNKFIATSDFGDLGGGSEKLVWEKLKEAFVGREVLAYYKFPLFTDAKHGRRQSDILLIDKEIGIVIVEVKGLAISQIDQVSGGLWYVNHYFDHDTINPSLQAERQMEILMKRYTNRKLSGSIKAKIIVCVPQITKQTWCEKGFNVEDQPLIFQDQLSPKELLGSIKEAPLLYAGSGVTDEQWEMLLVATGMGNSLVEQSDEVFRPGTKGEITRLLNETIYKLDLQQEQIAKVIPPGPQRIRGIAGSGKTVLLCQRAVHMHLAHPEWRIALVFFTKSLYESMLKYIDRYIKLFTGDEEACYQESGNLKVYHAWGKWGMPGLYREIAQQNGVKPLSVNDIENVHGRLKPTESLIYACKKLLEDKGGVLLQSFDAILVDEGQDLISSNDYKYEDKQAFYYMCYQALKPASELGLKRLTWAYDELQDFNTVGIPVYREIFGEHEVTKQLIQGPTYVGGINKSEVMKKCYRTPYQILVAGHALGMGIFREGGLLNSYGNQEDWRAIGYQVEQGRFNQNNRMRIVRPKENNVNQIEEIWKKSLIELSQYSDSTQMYNDLAKRVWEDIHTQRLTPSKQILILNVGDYQGIERIGNALNARDISYYVPKMPRPNMFRVQHFKETVDKQFWHEGAVTVANVIDAKGNEASMVYIVGLERIANSEDDISSRNSLFVALSRTKCWAHLMGVNLPKSFEKEIDAAINCNGVFEFDYRRPRRVVDNN